MKLGLYFKDNFYKVLIFIISYIINLLVFLAFKVNKSVIISSSFIYIICFSLIFFISYFRKKKFYTDLLLNIESLDKGLFSFRNVN